MHIKNIHNAIETLSECVNKQLSMGVEQINAEELKIASDALEKLCNAEYYAKISKAMEDFGEQRYYDRRREPREEQHHMTPERYDSIDWNMFGDKMRDIDRNKGRMYYTETRPCEASRKSYMDSKHNHDDREARIQKLDKYLNDIKDEMREIIVDMPPEDKTMWRTKLTNMVNTM